MTKIGYKRLEGQLANRPTDMSDSSKNGGK
jgi:hypothetical protein